MLITTIIYTMIFLCHDMKFKMMCITMWLRR